MPSRHVARATLVAALAATWLGLRAELVETFAAPVAAATLAMARALEPRPAQEVAPLEPLAGAAELMALEDAPAEAVAPVRTGATNAPPEPPPVTTGGIFVPRSRVMAAVKAGARPSSAGAAPATAWRPAGTVVVGVGALGVGLRDGDVVTRVGGAHATSANAVVGAVDAALRSGAPAISAEIWRGRHRIIVTVELPKLRRKRNAPSSRDATSPAEVDADAVNQEGGAAPTRPAASTAITRR